MGLTDVDMSKYREAERQKKIQAIKDAEIRSKEAQEKRAKEDKIHQDLEEVKRKNQEARE